MFVPFAARTRIRRSGIEGDKGGREKRSISIANYNFVSCKTSDRFRMSNGIPNACSCNHPCFPS